MADSPARNAFQLPDQYKFVKVLGEGGFGKVVKCWKKDTKHTVAVKIPKSKNHDNKEVSMLKKIMRLDLDQHNIVKFFGCFHTSSGRALVFETLDISIQEYIQKTCGAPMRLSDVSTVTQQLAKALDALKSVGVIHTDIKPDNIMLVDHLRRPFRVKLIDFGLAMLRSEAAQGMSRQTTNFRSPEIILGLPFSEAVDMWSLGCVMAIMVDGGVLFSAKSEYEALQHITELLGQPADRLLNDGQKTRLFFTRTESNSWRLKTHQEFWGQWTYRNCTRGVYRSLDDLKKLRLERKNEAEAVERQQCIELLEAMLTVDETERITPSEVLTHPFIDKGHRSSNTKNRFKMTMKQTMKIMNENLKPASTRLPPAVILVQPAAAENTLQMDSDQKISSQTHRNKTSMSELHQLFLTASAFLNEQLPAAAAPREDDPSSLHPDHHSPSRPTLPPSGVIMVRPAAADNTLHLEEEESAASLQAELNNSETVRVSDSVTAALTCTHSSICDATETQKQQKKKKQNVLRRFFRSCCTSVSDDEEGEAL